MVDLVIRAAGVVLLRPSGQGPKVLAVHRPRHKDWSLPKGKLDHGEPSLAAAVRECDEETGITPILGRSLGRQHYQVMGRPKTVDYWVAQAGPSHGFTPNDEVDEIRWLTLPQARRMLSYKRDVALVNEAMAMPMTVPLIVLRHTAATKRSDFRGKDDTKRPLSGKGRSQARLLIPLLSAFAPQQVHSSDSVRCLQTVTPFAEAAKILIDQEPIFSEPGHERRPSAAVRRLEALARTPERLVVCSHRPVLPDLLRPLADRAGKRIAEVLRTPLTPGSFVTVHRQFDRTGDWQVVAADRYDWRDGN